MFGTTPPQRAGPPSHLAIEQEQHASSGITTCGGLELARDGTFVAVELLVPKSIGLDTGPRTSDDDVGDEMGSVNPVEGFVGGLELGEATGTIVGYRDGVVVEGFTEEIFDGPSDGPAVGEMDGEYDGIAVRSVGDCDG